MKVDLHMYVAQPKKGHWEVCIPWVAALAEPIRGPSPSQLREELMFRTLELVHGGLQPAELDRLLPPIKPYLTSVYLDVRRKVDPDRPEVQLTGTTHVVVGTWTDDTVTRMWLPRAPGTCLAIASADDMYAALNQWATEWAETNLAEDLERLQCSFMASIDTMEIDLGWPLALPNQEAPMFEGRLRRPATLQEVATNLSHRVEDDSLGKAFGREDLVEELVEAIISPRPQNVCLVGPVGVGKTALVHEAARRAFGLARAYQERRDIWQTNGDRVIAGMSIIGQWEKRTESMCRELAERQDVVFIEDLLGVVRAGRTYHGDSTVARFIEPYLEQDRFSVITEATDETWALARSNAPGFVDKFRRIQVPPLSYRETLGVVTDLIREAEAGHPIRFTADGVETIMHLARRFFRQEAFPGKAVRLVKQCQYGALRALNDEPDLTELKIDPARVADVVQRQTGLPPTILRPGMGRDPSVIRSTFENRVFGQPNALNVVTRLVVAIEQGLTDPRRPLAALLLVGPSGVGKTETAKALAADLFGSDERMVRFDMSEFSESTAASRLIGTPASPDGELTSKVRLQPFCVLLFDEIEKAHPLVLDLLLQLLGDGRLTDAAGRTVDFRNAIVVMTSNLGASSEDRWLGFSDQSRSDRELHYRRAAEDFFRPELFNRIDHVVPYAPLGPEALRRIARRTLQNLLERRGLRQAQVMVDVDEGLIDYLARRSVDPRYGARTLANRIEQTLVAPLARQLTTWTERESLTRVIIKPAPEGVALELQTIERAPRNPTGAADVEEPLEPAVVADQLNRIFARAEALSNDGRKTAIVEDYEGLLKRINALGRSGEPSRELADELRRRETFLDRLGHVERRIAGMQDPGGSNQFVFAAARDERVKKGHAHRWARVASELETELAWLECQLRALASGHTAGGTLIVSGLSGPYGELLARWQTWLEALDHTFGLESTWARRTADAGWIDGALADGEAATAVAISSLAPGVADIFEALAGYTWSPRPPSHGQHALVVGRAVPEGQPTSLADELSKGVEDTGAARIEFVETGNQLEDLRTGRRFSIPEDRSANLREFVTHLAFDRVTSVSHSSEEVARG